MTEFHVSELMVPLSEYATVPKGSTLYEAVSALELAQEKFEDTHTRYRHRAVLVLDKNGKVIGKVSQMDVLRALEPEGNGSERIMALSQFGFSASFIQHLHKQQRLRANPLRELCQKAARMKVEDVMQMLAEKFSLEVDYEQLIGLIGNDRYLKALKREVVELEINSISNEQMASLWNSLGKPALGGERWTIEAVAALVD